MEMDSSAKFQDPVIKSPLTDSDSDLFVVDPLPSKPSKSETPHSHSRSPAHTHSPSLSHSHSHSPSSSSSHAHSPVSSPPSARSRTHSQIKSGGVSQDAMKEMFEKSIQEMLRRYILFVFLFNFNFERFICFVNILLFFFPFLSFSFFLFFFLLSLDRR